MITDCAVCSLNLCETTTKGELDADQVKMTTSGDKQQGRSVGCSSGKPSGLGLFMTGNPAYERHIQTIQQGAASDAALRERGRVGLLDGDERIASLAAAYAADEAATRAPVQWTIKPSDRPRKPPRQGAPEDPGWFALWTRRHVRTIIVLLLLATLCGSHGWRLAQRIMHQTNTTGHPARY